MGIEEGSKTAYNNGYNVGYNKGTELTIKNMDNNLVNCNSCGEQFNNTYSIDKEVCEICIGFIAGENSKSN